MLIDQALRRGKTPPNEPSKRAFKPWDFRICRRLAIGSSTTLYEPHPAAHGDPRADQGNRAGGEYRAPSTASFLTRPSCRRRAATYRRRDECETGGEPLLLHRGVDQGPHRSGERGARCRRTRPPPAVRGRRTAQRHPPIRVSSAVPVVWVLICRRRRPATASAAWKRPAEVPVQRSTIESTAWSFIVLEQPHPVQFLEPGGLLLLIGGQFLLGWTRQQPEPFAQPDVFARQRTRVGAGRE